MKLPVQRRVGIIGHGAIGSRVAAEIALGKVQGAELAAIVARRTLTNAPAVQMHLAEALEHCDLIVECAGQEALVAYGETVLSAGVDLLITSIGALADPIFLKRLEAAGPGRLFLTSGAIGGLDLLASGARSSGYDKVVVTTTKLPSSLIQPWMDPEKADSINSTAAPLEIFSGPASDAARLFPRSLNVVAAVAMAIGNWGVVNVKLVADPGAELTKHVIEASGGSGAYRFEISNKPSPENPRTSGVVPFSVLRTLELIVGDRGGLI